MNGSPSKTVNCFNRLINRETAKMKPKSLFLKDDEFLDTVLLTFSKVISFLYFVFEVFLVWKLGLLGDQNMIWDRAIECIWGEFEMADRTDVAKLVLKVRLTFN